MATIGVVEKYKTLIKRLYPTGWAWQFTDLFPFDKYVTALAQEACRIEERGFDLLDELDPSTTFELLPFWERLLGIPDECTPADADLSLAERRARILQKLTTGGGQSPAFYKLIAAQLGYDAEIIDVVDFRDFRAGLARAGDRISNSTSPGGNVNSAGWAYTFAIQAPAELTRFFRAGQSVAGDPLVLIENETLECVIRKFAPAHVIVQFRFG